MPDEQKAVTTQDKGLMLTQTLPIFQEQNGGRHGWWENSEGELRLQTLRNAFLMGASDAEACYIAGITKRSLYYYCSKVNPSFSEEKENLKLNVVFTARKVLIKKVITDPEYAWKFLQKKLPQEFGDSNNVTNNLILGDQTNIFDKDFLSFPDEPTNG